MPAAMSATDAELSAMQNDLQTKQQRLAALRTQIQDLRTAIATSQESTRKAREGVIVTDSEGNTVNREHEAVKAMVAHK